jgi:hypothetical protein
MHDLLGGRGLVVVLRIEDGISKGAVALVLDGLPVVVEDLEESPSWPCRFWHPCWMKEGDDGWPVDPSCLCLAAWARKW